MERKPEGLELRTLGYRVMDADHSSRDIGRYKRSPLTMQQQYKKVVNFIGVFFQIINLKDVHAGVEV